jgi:hypothetical protein
MEPTVWRGSKSVWCQVEKNVLQHCLCLQLTSLFLIIIVFVRPVVSTTSAVVCLFFVLVLVLSFPSPLLPMQLFVQSFLLKCVSGFYLLWHKARNSSLAIQKQLALYFQLILYSHLLHPHCHASCRHFHQCSHNSSPHTWYPSCVGQLALTTVPDAAFGLSAFVHSVPSSWYTLTFIRHRPFSV